MTRIRHWIGVTSDVITWKGDLLRRGHVSTFFLAVMTLSLGFLANPVQGISIPGLGGDGGTPSPSTSPTPTSSGSPTPNPSISTSPAPIASPSQSLSPQPTSSPTPSSFKKPLLIPVKPLRASSTIAIPDKFSNLPPILLRVPKKWQISDRRDSINVRSWCSKPKEILANAYIGGDCNLALIPLATISRNSLFEVQTQVFTPTRILLKGLRPNIAIDITAKKPNGTSRSLGTARSDTNGDLRLPPLTLGKSGSFIEIEFTWPQNVKYLFILRAIK